MVKFLINPAVLGAALIRGKRLLEGGTYSDLSSNGAAFIKVWRLFEAQHLLEEIRYRGLHL